MDSSIIIENQVQLTQLGNLRNHTIMNSSLALQLQQHLKPTIAAPENLGSLLARRLKVTKSKTKLHKSKSKQASSFVFVVSNNSVDPFAELRVQQVMERQSKALTIPRKEIHHFPPAQLNEAYETCRQICAERSTTYYLGSLLMTEERKKAIWAVYAWGQRTDELVDGAKSKPEGSEALDSWEERLEDIFDGRPHDIADTALADTFQRFPLDIKPFKDVIKGMRMDTWKTRHDNYKELELYCCYVAATGCLMAIPIAGISPEYVSSTQSIYEAALSLGIGNQLTNILRDVDEDASRGRVYLPQDELREFGLTDEDIFSKNVTDEWRE